MVSGKAELTMVLSKDMVLPASVGVSEYAELRVELSIIVVVSLKSD